METDVQSIVESPLFMVARPGAYLRLVLAEAAAYGMPPQVIATLDDVAAMLGFYAPIPANLQNHIAGPLVQWQTDRKQPHFARVNDLEALALKQRTLLAFGGGPEHHRVGTAEIVVALGNCHKEAMPPEYWDIFTWASTRVLQILEQVDPDALRKERDWPHIRDEDVLLPSGRLHRTYTVIATEIRRQAIAALKGDPDNPRAALKPLGAHLLAAITRRHDANDAEVDPETRDNIARVLQPAIDNIKQMYPDLIADALPPNDP